MKRIPYVVLMLSLLLAACSKPDGVVELAPQFGAPEVRAVDLAIGANLYATTSQLTYTYDDARDPLQAFSSVTVSRFDARGKVLWERDLIGYAHDVPPSVDFYPELTQSLIETDGSGNAYSFTEVSEFQVCPEGGVTFDNKLTKLSPTGKRLWSKKITGSVTGFVVDRAGNVYLTGVNRQPEACSDTFNDLYFLRKYTPNGSLVWSRNVGDYPQSLAVTPWGSAFVARSVPVGREVDTQLSRYTVAGKLLWTKTVDYTEEMVFSKDYLYTLAFAVGGGGQVQSKLGKFDPQGNLVWARTYAGTKETLPNLAFRDLTVDPAGNIIMVGDYDVTADNSTTALRKVNSAGKTLWTKTLESFQDGYSSSIGNRDNGGSIYVGGVSNGSSLLYSLDRGGNEDWVIR